MNHLANISAYGEEFHSQISSKNIAISGCNLTTEFTLCNLIGLGFGAIHIYDSQISAPTIFGKLAHQPKHVHRVSKGFKHVCPSAPITGIFGPALFQTLDSLLPSIYIDMGVEPDAELYKHATKYNKPYIRVHKYCSFTDTPTSLFHPHHNPPLVGALIAERCRHIIFPFSNQTWPHSYDIPKAQLSTTKQCIVGVGGIGTYVSLFSTLCNTSHILLFDHDTVEDTNLNRQICYATYIDQPKVTAMADILSECSTAKIIPKQQKISHNDRTKHSYNVFCCVDSESARAHVSRFAHASHSTLLNGGCNPRMAQSHLNSPSIHKPLHEIYGWKISKEAQSAQPQSCARQVNPSIVTTNCIAAGLMHAHVSGTYYAKGGRLSYEY